MDRDTFDHYARCDEAETVMHLNWEVLQMADSLHNKIEQQLAVTQNQIIKKKMMRLAKIVSMRRAEARHLGITIDELLLTPTETTQWSFSMRNSLIEMKKQLLKDSTTFDLIIGEL